MPEFLSVGDVMHLHQNMVELFGGDPTLRDLGLLESAVAMPQAGFGGHYLHEGIPAMAAAYLFHVTRNHAFVDGNKRTGLHAATVFLDINGHRLDAREVELYQLTIDVAAGQLSREKVTLFFPRTDRLRAV